MNHSLNKSLYAIGIRITGDFTKKTLEEKSEWVDIEQTLIEACYEMPSDNRLFSLVLSWVKVHGNYLISEKLIKLYKITSKTKGESPWFNALVAFAAVECSHKFTKWVKPEKEIVYLGDKESVEGLIAIKGAIPYFEKINIMMARSSLRIRERDAFTQKELININLQYKNRYIFGPSWRADIITAIENGINNPYQIAKKIGCSYEPANRIFREYALANS
ncbi:MAG: hypothetical protein A2381_17260 [Bdellovibrionales bacterium RIFOXYB1_FULL_37_110]|nr:MAG: hypothetical protein A2181_08265 [Bdellovibrionales bacterium RIFOXYA1_FULL_38_20]OFZ50144.1 MAG: hypothetical protein A2417_19095 [Bdellovibrionales bacterium RIFOXYC1_FULL_37_79]OFZ60050.1 MAG: hypothetical protein A2381_17260 [Bdellovibrionales bacterium RIFOXYB1_FULL_37_110]OFZ62674.1 MAG: hypothetical protein A2577_16255 [Bdellovibrionales bacterium RIFOXYD1_FULL_36_51]